MDTVDSTTPNRLQSNNLYAQEQSYETLQWTMYVLDVGGRNHSGTNNTSPV